MDGMGLTRTETPEATSLIRIRRAEIADEYLRRPTCTSEVAPGGAIPSRSARAARVPTLLRGLRIVRTEGHAAKIPYAKPVIALARSF